MITTGLIYFLYYGIYLVTFPLRALDDVTVNSTIVSAFLTLNEWLALFKNILPLTVIGSALLVFLAIEAGIASYKLIMWTMRRIWGS